MSLQLPVHSVLPGLKAALRAHRNVVLQAPPGAGKSTVVPLELLGEPWLAGKRILMLEPRRLAARAVAARTADSLGEAVGQTVGYRMRLDSRVSAGTRIEVVTEGVLAAMLHSDPALENVGCVIFDEFHERSLQADLGLALCLDVQAHLNEELRLLVMSATLAAEPVARLMGDAPIVRAEGRMFPVEVRYLPPPATGTLTTGVDPQSMARTVAGAVRRALQEAEGDVLVFLPGAGEIRRVQQLLAESPPGPGVLVAPLYGELTREAQDAALQPAPRGKRKVVLATNIAETSLTIEGVRVVVDSGYERRNRFDPVTGMSRLETLRISRASAEQRCGRAGRLAPGVCYRLWSEGVQQTLQPHTPAEILEADLAPLALELAGWNVADPASLRWLDPPPAATYGQARDLLRRLGALDAGGRITEHGREMLRLRVHPRLAHLLLRSRDLGLEKLACDLAALLGERDVLRGRERDADLGKRIEVLRGEAAGGEEVDRGALERVRRASAMYLRTLNAVATRSSRRSDAAGNMALSEADAIGVLVALAYPDRVARARAAGSGRYRLSNGRGAFFAEPQALAREEFLAVAELDAGEREARIFLAAPLSRAALETVFADGIETNERIRWDAQQQAVLATVERRFGELVLEEKPLQKADPEAVRAALIEGIRQMSLAVLPWTDELEQWRARVRFVRTLVGGALGEREEEGGGEDRWPDVSDEGLMRNLEQWLGPCLDGMSRREHLSRLDLRAALESLLSWEQRQRLNELAPTHLTTPGGSRIRIDYLEGDTPSLSAPLQELFGLQESPRIGGGKVPVLIKLLSPARRPVQVTRDLASFWRTGYEQVRKELKGRYPKHYWPDDPFQAEPIRGTRKRRE